MDSKKLGVAVVALLVLVGGYFVYNKITAKDEAKPETAETSENKADSKVSLNKKTEKVPPPMSPQQRQVSMDDDPEGPLRLEGQVIDDTGSGVPGAQVTLSSNPPRTVNAEDDGSFVFEKLIGRTYALSARAGDLVGGPMAYKLTGEGDQAIIRMRAGGGVTVKVRADATGKPISGATVELRKGERRTESADSDGVAVFNGVGSGWFVAVARAPGFGVARQGMMMPSTPGAKLTVELSLTPGVTVSGIVTGDGGAPLEGATVAAKPVGQIFDGLNPRYDGVKTDASGAFRLDGVPLGKTQLVALHKDYIASTSEVLELSADTEGVSIKMERGALIKGRVLTSSREAVPWATVTVRPEGDASATWGGSNRGTTADEKGEFEIKGLPRAAMTLLASSEQASSEVISVALDKKDEVTGLEVVLTVTGTISGKVVDSAGNELPEVQVILFPDWTSGVDTKRMMLSQGDSTTTAGDGTFTFNGLSDGVFMLKATRDSGSMLFWQVEGERAKTGDKDVELVLPENGGIQGRVVSERGEAIRTFSITVGWPPGHPFSDADGKFELSSIPPGKYDLKVRGADFAETTVRDVEVSPSKTVNLGEVKVVRGRTLSGRVVDSGGSPVAGATIVMAQRLMGSGDAISFSTDPNTDEMMGIRRGTSDDNGSFRIRGIPGHELVVAAEHKDKGRSRPAILAKSAADSELTLTLLPTGTVKGIVKRGDTPAPGVNVLATPSEARLQMVIGQTDDKGAYTLSRLAEGNYEVSAVFGGGMSQQGVTRKVVIKGGDEHEIDLVFKAGPISLKVTVTPEPSAKVDAVQLFLFPGELAVANAKELTDAFLGRESSGAAMQFSMKGAPVEFKELATGPITLCGIPITGDMSNPQFMQRLQENAIELKVVCKAATLAESPVEQSLEIVVPEMDPLPEPEGQPSP